MSRPDATASAALGLSVIKPIFLVYLDIDGDEVRANTSGYDMALTGTGDPDLDGFTYYGISGDFIDISPVKNVAGGSDTVTGELSGIEGVDSSLLASIQDKTNWQGRVARLWRIVRDGVDVQQGGIQSYYTGYMMALDHIGSVSGQTLRMTIESYLAILSQASYRTYLQQELYDAGDLSARAGIAIANGIESNAAASTGFSALYRGVMGNINAK